MLNKENERKLGKKITVWFSASQLDVINKIKEIRKGVSTSYLIRELLENHLKELKK